MEDIAGFIIAILIFIAALSIVYEAAGKMIEGSVVGMVSIGIYVTAAAIVINIIISWYVFRVARATESIALEATARDMTADIMSSVAVLLGLILVKFTGFTIIDSVVALIVSILIGKAAYDTMRKSIRGLMDTKLPEEEEEKIRSTVLKRTGEFLDVHQLRSRKSGDHRYVIFM
jgi:cation diffusion facilitator family transporter